MPLPSLRRKTRVSSKSSSVLAQCAIRSRRCRSRSSSTVPWSRATVRRPASDFGGPMISSPATLTTCRCTVSVPFGQVEVGPAQPDGLAPA